jgi:hypothetical protein
MGDRMKLEHNRGLGVIVLLLAGLVVAFAQVRSREVLWVDFDMEDIPEPKERSSNYYDDFFKGQILEGAKQRLDVPRWIRQLAGNPKEASNVNALDEVPDSSWYSNRHHLRRMSASELERGPNRGSPPDFSVIRITRAKPGGISPGMMVSDANGASYLIKFDAASYPNLRSGAEVVSTKILYAAGYNVPENYIAYVDPARMSIAGEVEFKDPKTGENRLLTQDDVAAMLRGAVQTPEGRYRVLASEIIKGIPKGPFADVGLRRDDPNDLIPHEHRRELRAMRVIASWINNWDLKESQSLDVYVEEDGRKFLRHYLLDFGSSLGAAYDPAEYYHGHEHGFDLMSIAKEIFSLGVHESDNEKRALILSPEAGSFTAAEFDPGNWKPTFPKVMFSNMTSTDAYWATRVILAFTPEDLRSIIKTAEYSLPTTDNYILETLLARRTMIARYWLPKSDALSEFRVENDAEGVAFKFKDLLVEQGLVAAGSVRYSYQVKGGRFKSKKLASMLPEIRIDRAVLGAALEHGAADRLIEVRIWAHRDDSTPQPVSVYFDWNPKGGAGSVRRIARG